MKTLFVTVGTTKFTDLIQAVSSNQFIKAALEAGYTTWIVQHGDQDHSVLDNIRTFGRDISLEHFAYKVDISVYFLRADLVISHGGSGSILDALRGPLFGAKERPKAPYLVVVPNRSLLNDHQMELILELGRLNIVNVSDTVQLHQVFRAMGVQVRLLDPDYITINDML